MEIDPFPGTIAALHRTNRDWTEAARPPCPRQRGQRLAGPTVLGRP